MTPLPDPMVRDAREEKLPAWASRTIGTLRSALRANDRAYAERAAELEARIATLEALAGQAQDAGADADTVLVLDDPEDTLEVPLGKGRTIEFADFYTVRYGPHDQSGGARVLVVQTRQAMQIRTTYDPNEIIIARA